MGAKYCATKHGRQWLEKNSGLYEHMINLAISYQFLINFLTYCLQPCHLQVVDSQTSLRGPWEPRGSQRGMYKISLTRTPGNTQVALQGTCTPYQRVFRGPCRPLWQLSFDSLGRTARESADSCLPPTHETCLPPSGGDKIHSWQRQQPKVGSVQVAQLLGCPNGGSNHGHCGAPSTCKILQGSGSQDYKGLMGPYGTHRP